MNVDLTEDQISDYRERGYLLIPDLLDTGELEHWRKTTAEALARRNGQVLPPGQKAGKQHHRQPKSPGAKLKRRVATLLKGAEHGNQVNSQREYYTEHVNLWSDNPDYRALILSSELASLPARLEGLESWRVWTDKALFKMPWNEATVWHSDSPYGSYRSSQSVTIWIALDDATVQNGCLYYLPGTHKTHGDEAYPLGRKIAQLFESRPDFAELEAAPATLKAGGCAVHNAHIVHSAGPNMTPFPRRAVNITYIPDGATYSGKPSFYLPPELVANLTTGAPLDHPRYTPMIYPPDRREI